MWECSLAYWLAPQGLLSLISYSIQDFLHRVAPPTMVWAIPQQSPSKKAQYSLASNQLW